MSQLESNVQIAGEQRQNQYERLLTYFTYHRGEWIPLPNLMNLRMASLTKRISELRAAGHVIQIREKRVGPERHVEYRYAPAPKQTRFGF
jgi:hypothetical protein